MREFFRGWRRKAGLVTLAMACLLTTAWNRSHVASDILSFMLPWRQQMIVSSPNRIIWLAGYDDETFGLGLEFDSPDADEMPTLVEELTNGNPQHYEFGLWIIPYWSLVLPLTLLSAWLILGKRQKKKGGV